MKGSLGSHALPFLLRSSALFLSAFVFSPSQWLVRPLGGRGCQVAVRMWSAGAAEALQTKVTRTPQLNESGGKHEAESKLAVVKRDARAKKWRNRSWRVGCCDARSDHFTDNSNPSSSLGRLVYGILPVQPFFSFFTVHLVCTLSGVLENNSAQRGCVSIRRFIRRLDALAGMPSPNPTSYHLTVVWSFTGFKSLETGYQENNLVVRVVSLLQSGISSSQSDVGSDICWQHGSPEV